MNFFSRYLLATNYILFHIFYIFLSEERKFFSTQSRNREVTRKKLFLSQSDSLIIITM